MRCALFLLPLLLVGCTFGPTLEDYSLAKRPSGVHATLATKAHGTVAGEVLAVRATTLIVRTAPRPNEDPGIVQVEYAAIRHGTFRDPSLLDISSSYWTPIQSWRDRLRRRSRFPQGLSPKIMARLLQQHNQATLLTIP